MGQPLLNMSEDCAEFVKVVHSFCVDKVAPRAREIDESDVFFPDLLQDAAELGLQSLIFDEDGGIEPEGFDIAHETSEVIASFSGAVALGVSIARLHGYMLARYARPEVRDRWLPGLQQGTTFGSFMISEAHAGTDVRGITTVAHQRGDEWVVNGEKAWITQSPEASFGILLTKVGSTDRDAPTAAFVLDYATSGVEVGKEEPMLSFRGMPMASVALNDVVIPAECQLNVDGFGGMLEGVNLARIDVAAYGLGFMRGCLREVSEYTSTRDAFGTSMDRLQLVQAGMGQMLAEYLTAREVVLAAVRSFAAGGGGDNSLISAAKIAATEGAQRVALSATQLLGGAGVHMEYTPQRFLRDAKAITIIDGTTQIHQLMLGRSVSRTDWNAAIPTRA